MAPDVLHASDRKRFVAPDPPPERGDLRPGAGRTYLYTDRLLCGDAPLGASDDEVIHALRGLRAGAEGRGDLRRVRPVRPRRLLAELPGEVSRGEHDAED